MREMDVATTTGAGGATPRGTRFQRSCYDDLWLGEEAVLGASASDDGTS